MLRGAFGTALVAWLAWAVAWAPGTLRAQAPAAPQGEAGPAAPVLKPPRLAQFVEAGYPEAALAERLEARVLVEIVVGTDGRVVDARVVEPAGHGFDPPLQVA